jgi:uncharacterized iron-regulated membrane protein
MRLPKKFAQKSRKAFYFIHLWTGLLLGLWLVLMGLTGSLLSWRSEISEWEARQRVSAPTPDSNAKHIPVSAAIAALKAVDPELTPERNMTLPISKTGYYMHSARGEVNGERVSRLFLVNPVTAKVYPPVNASTFWISTTEEFHHNLLVGVKGTVTNGFFTFFTLFMLVSGAWLWWPSNIKQLKARLSWKRGVSLRRTLYDLHNMMGVYLFGLLFLLTLTGVVICYNGQTDQSITRGVNRLAGVKEEPRGRRGGASRGEGRGEGRRGREGGVPVEEDPNQLPIDVIVEKARAALPGNRLISIASPRRPGQPFQANYEMVRITSGGVPFDPHTGERLNADGTVAFGRPYSPGTKFMGAVFHLHYGWFGGNWSKVLYCLSGFMPLGLFITGVWMWGRKKKFELDRNKKRKAMLAEPKTAAKPVPSSVGEAVEA